MQAFVVPGDVLVAHLQGEAVLLHMDSKRYYRLNDTAACIWKAIERGEKLPQIVAAVRGEFEVSAEIAEREVERMVGDLLERGLLTRPSAEERRE